jgi:hypothetical protein
MAPNNAYFVSIPQVGVDHLRRAGMDLDVQTTDFTTMLPRRSSPGFRRTKVVEHFWGNYGNAALLSYPACGLAAPLSALCCEGSAILHRLSGQTHMGSSSSSRIYNFIASFPSGYGSEA